MVQRNAPYLPKEYNNTGIAERYWLNSNGVYLKIDNDAPLFIDQNNEHPDHLCIKVRRASPYDISQPTFDFVYHIGVGVNVRDAHMKAVQRFLGKPSGYPSEKLVNNPIWSTWAKYKVNSLVT
jgi:myogenesis-regulating glycosidase